MSETTLLAVGAMFAAVALASAAARALGQSVIPFYIVAGVLVGPHVAGDLGLPAIADGEFVTVLAELGVVSLLFFLGLEFSIDRLLESGDRLLKAGGLDLAVNFAAGFLLGIAIGWSTVEAFVLGGIVYISSDATITESLIGLGWIANSESEPMLGTLVFEDIAIAIYLAVLSAAVLGSGDLGTALRGVGIAAAFLAVLLAGVYYGGALFERYLAVDSNELFVLRAVAAATLVAGAAFALGISEAVAAFFVGMGFSSTGHVHQPEGHLAPLRDAFAAVFFFWIGVPDRPGAGGGDRRPAGAGCGRHHPDEAVHGLPDGAALRPRRPPFRAGGLWHRGPGGVLADHRRDGRRRGEPGPLGGDPRVRGRVRARHERPRDDADGVPRRTGRARLPVGGRPAEDPKTDPDTVA